MLPVLAKRLVALLVKYKLVNILKKKERNQLTALIRHFLLSPPKVLHLFPFVNNNVGHSIKPPAGFSVGLNAKQQHNESMLVSVSTKCQCWVVAHSLY